MLPSLLIVFREALEAGLIIGIVLAATQGLVTRGRWIAGGIATGVAGSGLLALFAAQLSALFEGAGQEVFTATILLLAVAMLAWHILWMSRHAREMAAEMRAAGEAVRLGQRSLGALAGVVAVAVMREGAEVVLFLYGIAAGSDSGAGALLAGGTLGLGAAALASWLLYRGLVVIPLHRLFGVTNVLIALLAAGMAGQAAAVLHGADLLPGWGERLWDTSFLLADNTILGRTLHALVGYSARPSGIQMAAWLATLAVLAGASRIMARPRLRLAVAAMMAGMVALAVPARAADTISVAFRNHRFEPARIEAPAGVKFRLEVKNLDSTADEFESDDLGREKLVPAGQSVIIFLGPLKPGEYKFFGEMHKDTAQGVLVVK